jgi:hypothetical protein
MIQPSYAALAIAILSFVLCTMALLWVASSKWRRRKGWKNVPPTVFRIPDDCHDQPKRMG